MEEGRTECQMERVTDLNRRKVTFSGEKEIINAEAEKSLDRGRH